MLPRTHYELLVTSLLSVLFLFWRRLLVAPVFMYPQCGRHETPSGLQAPPHGVESSVPFFHFVLFACKVDAAMGGREVVAARVPGCLPLPGPSPLSPPKTPPAPLSSLRPLCSVLLRLLSPAPALPHARAELLERFRAARISHPLHVKHTQLDLLLCHTTCTQTQETQHVHKEHVGAD